VCENGERRERGEIERAATTKRWKREMETERDGGMETETEREMEGDVERDGCRPVSGRVCGCIRRD